ncbi:hypothetical protein [Paenibacillus sp. Leaf72]|uniref:hypothetical protein n=1 Tax=Paenibacillus sp. Leaf72 TaxID=1736234 RepID=UPI0006F6379E|nr:hypothetical protein [Paenibacillus sp. Leaf72]KQO18154.1 hypothetical protein ASF12_05810 [Paenibacillus sp. Leaf72]
MKKYTVIIVLFLLVAAALTVPSKQQYAEWLKGHIKEKNNSLIINLGVDLLGITIIEKVTTCQSYVVLSVCTTKISGPEKIKAAGIFNHFIPLQFPK